MGDKVSYIRTHYLPHIVSLAVAIMLWMYVQNSEQIEITRRIPIQMLLPDDVGIVSRPPQDVIVRIRGARSSLRNMNGNAAHFINLKGMGIKGRKSLIIPVRPEELPIQHFGIKLIDYSPKEVTLDLDTQVVRQIPVKAALVGDIQNGGTLLSQNIFPSTVSVSGAKEYLKSISYISTKPIDLALATSSGEWKVALDLDDSRITLGQGEAKEATVRLEMSTAKIESRNVQLPIRFLSLGQLFRPSHRQVIASIEYPSNIDIESLSKNIRIDAEVLEMKGQQEIRLSAKIPEGLRLIKIEPEIIMVKIERGSLKK